MALLKNSQIQNNIYLCDHHTFGRKRGSVDTYVGGADISSLHAVILWTGTYWGIRDISRNGTWIDGKKLESYKLYRLELHQKISFSLVSDGCWIVEDLKEPEVLLVAAHPGSKVISLSSCNLLPNDRNPSLVFYFDASDQVWYCESLGENSADPNSRYPVIHNQFIRIEGSVWQFKVCNSRENTREPSHQIPDLLDSKLEFTVSQDEEEVSLKLLSRFRQWDLGCKAHHYLLLYLSRYRIEHAGKGISLEQQGWVDNQVISLETGYDEQYINILIYRIKQQIAQKIEFAEGASLLERKRGKTRIAIQANKVTIFKESQLHAVV